jgi:hypothetical protein
LSEDGSNSSLLPTGAKPALLQQTETVIKISHDILSVYDKVGKKCGSRKLEFPTQLWKQDEKDMKDLLENGKNYGNNLIETLIVPAENVNLPSTEHGNVGIELFGGSRRSLECETWGQAAHAQVKALTAMLATLPAKPREK